MEAEKWDMGMPVKGGRVMAGGLWILGHYQSAQNLQI
jgi:hypothetical protein